MGPKQIACRLFGHYLFGGVGSKRLPGWMICELFAQTKNSELYHRAEISAPLHEGIHHTQRRH